MSTFDRVAFALLCVVLAAACTQTDPVVTTTQVTVRISSSDAELTSALTQLHVRAAMRLNGNAWREPDTNSFPASGLRWPVEIPVFPRSPSEASGQFEIVAEAVQNDVVLAEARAITSFRPDKHVVLDLVLFRCPGKAAGYVCSPGCRGAECKVCTTAGECEPVRQYDPSSLQPAVTPESPDSGTDAGSELDAAVPGSDGSTQPSLDGQSPIPPGDSSVPSQVDGTTPAQNDGATPLQTPDGSAPECDPSRPCSAGYTCTQDKCVSRCTQTQCDPNATCALMANAPVCTCNRGFISRPGAGGAVTCVADVQCEQLGCHADATCEVGTDQLRRCVCKTGFTGTGRSCAPVDCGTPSLTNGTATAVNGVTTYLGTVNYECSAGYARSGAATATCGVDARWSATATCAAVDCGTPTLTNGRGTPSSGTTTFGSTANWSCNVGFNRSGSATGMCGANRAWSPIPTCQPVTCPTPDPPTRGAVTRTNGNNFESVATYSCNGGTLQGNQTRTCQASGQWSGTAPTCLYCGDGEVNGQEQCDPSVPNSNPWTCTTSCSRTTAYTPCLTGTPSSCATNEVCYNAGICLPRCGIGITCPATPSGSRTFAQCAMLSAATSLCLMGGCVSNADCAPGLICRSSSCTVCTLSSECPSGQRCVPHNMATSDVGHCEW